MLNNPHLFDNLVMDKQVYLDHLEREYKEWGAKLIFFNFVEI